MRFAEYLESEISRRKKFSSAKLINSKAGSKVIKKLYECKDSAGFEKLRASQDKAQAEILKDILDRLSIDSFESLQKWAKDIRDTSATLAALEKDGKEAVTKDEFMRAVRLKRMGRKKAEHFLRALMFEFVRKCDASFTARDLMREYLEIMNPADANSLYEMLMLTLAPLASKTPKKSDSPESEEPHEDLPQTPEVEVPADSAKLAAQLEELRVELESAYIRLNSSEENFERFQQESAELAVVDVLGRMNSQEAGQLLDQFAKSEQTLKQLALAGYEVPQELSSVSLCVKMFMRTMRNIFGISPVHVIGEKLKLRLEQAEGYDYSGSDFEDDGEVKEVEVISPGWRYGNEIFSLPKVLECRE